MEIVKMALALGHLLYLFGKCPNSSRTKIPSRGRYKGFCFTLLSAGTPSRSTEQCNVSSVHCYMCTALHCYMCTVQTVFRDVWLMCTVLCTMISTVDSIQWCAMYSIQYSDLHCTGESIAMLCTRRRGDSTLRTLIGTLYTTHFTVYTSHYALFT